MQLYSIFMTWIAAKLCNSGFPILRMSRNQKNPKYMVYQFEDTKEFRNTLAAILADEVDNHGRKISKNNVDRQAQCRHS